jgi:hypothetical protein
MGLAYDRERGSDAGARAEPQRGLVMLNRDVGLARQSLSMPPMCQPRAKLGFSTRARSANAVIAPMSSPK